MAERYPVGTRVVLVEDHRFHVTYGRKGWVGVVVGPFDLDSERLLGEGGYTVRFDHDGSEWRVNASAVALLDEGYADADLAMAGDLANLLDDELSVYGSYFSQWRVAAWLREQALNELKARVR